MLKQQVQGLEKINKRSNKKIYLYCNNYHNFSMAALAMMILDVFVKLCQEIEFACLDFGS